MAKPSFITEKLMEALSWEYQAQEALYDLLIPMVPPGRALRQWETRQKHNPRAKEGLERGRPLPSESDRIYSGARDIVRGSINGLIDSGWAERTDLDNGEIMLRRRDRRMAAPVHRDGDCQECGRPFVSRRETTVPRRKMVRHSDGSYSRYEEQKKSAQVITIMDLLQAKERRMGREAK